MAYKVRAQQLEPVLEALEGRIAEVTLSRWQQIVSWILQGLAYGLVPASLLFQLEVLPTWTEGFLVLYGVGAFLFLPVMVWVNLPLIRKVFEQRRLYDELDLRAPQLPIPSSETGARFGRPVARILVALPGLASVARILVALAELALALWVLWKLGGFDEADQPAAIVFLILLVVSSALLLSGKRLSIGWIERLFPVIWALVLVDLALLLVTDEGPPGVVGPQVTDLEPLWLHLAAATGLLLLTCATGLLLWKKGISVAWRKRLFKLIGWALGADVLLLLFADPAHVWLGLLAALFVCLMLLLNRYLARMLERFAPFASARELYRSLLERQRQAEETGQVEVDLGFDTGVRLAGWQRLLSQAARVEAISNSSDEGEAGYAVLLSRAAKSRLQALEPLLRLTVTEWIHGLTEPPRDSQPSAGGLAATDVPETGLKVRFEVVEEPPRIVIVDLIESERRRDA